MEMITIKVHFSGELSDLVGLKEDEWEIPKGISFAQLLEGFKEEYGEEVYNFIKNPPNKMMVYLNGRDGNSRGGFNMIFEHDGDDLSFMVPYGKLVMLKDVGGSGAF